MISSQNGERKTLIGVLAGHDSVIKNNELARLLEELYLEDRELLGQFHFVFTGGTFDRVVAGTDREAIRRGVKPIDDRAREFLMSSSPAQGGGPLVTRLPAFEEGGIIVLANLVVQRQCSIVWPFLSPITVHWLNPENLALMRLCDLWNAKRLMNAESVRAWFRDEAERDVKRNPQEIPLKIVLSTPELDGPWPRAEPQLDRGKGRSYYGVKLPQRRRRTEEFWGQFDKQVIALIAHDEMKARMRDFAIQYENELSQFRYILSTGGTGQEVMDACRKLREQDKVKRCLPGPKGGDIEIATEILFDRCHIVIFFIDPLHPHPHIDDIRVVFSACMAEIEGNNVRMLTNEVQAREWVEEAVRRRWP